MSKDKATAPLRDAMLAKVVKERNEALAEVARLREAAEAAITALELLRQWVGPPPTGPYDFDSLREDGWKTSMAVLSHLRAALSSGKE